MSVPITETSLWGQVHMRVAPDESELPPRAHSRSRDLPRGIGGPHGEAEVGHDSWWGQGH